MVRKLIVTIHLNSKRISKYIKIKYIFVVSIQEDARRRLQKDNCGIRFQM